MKKKSSTVPVTRIPSENEQNQPVPESKVKCVRCKKTFDYKDEDMLVSENGHICRLCFDSLMIGVLAFQKKSSTVPVTRISSEGEQNQETTESKVKKECDRCRNEATIFKVGDNKTTLCWECYEEHITALQAKRTRTRIPSEHHIKHVVAAPKVKKSEVWLKAWLAMANGGNLPQPSCRPGTCSSLSVDADECVIDYFKRFGGTNE